MASRGSPAVYGVCWQRCNARCRCSNLMSNAPEDHLRQIWCLLAASRRQTPRRSASVFQRDSQWHSEAHFSENGVSWWRRDARRRLFL
jgi:hypothetical protein